MIVNCLMPFSAVRQWENTTVGHRGSDYEQWKQQLVERVFWRLEQLHPGIRQCVDEFWSSSPLTIRDFFGQPEGALYGVRKDCQNIMLSQLPIWTKVKNLLLTGQNINLHGICGVPLTAVNTVEALVGQNKLIEKINNLYNKTYGKD
jgi:all-trans-retinol 13,14-reductase